MNALLVKSVKISLGAHFDKQNQLLSVISNTKCENFSSAILSPYHVYFLKKRKNNFVHMVREVI